jgi:hypothetical protein
MKYITLVFILLSTSLFANYAYTGENSGKIDMHGGQGDGLLNKKSSFSNKGMSSLSNMGIKKPSGPLAPKPLIKKEETKKDKETTK